MKNRILSILLALALLCAILPAASLRASAETISGTCGDNLTWTFDPDTGMLTIEGSGEMYDYGYGGAPWYEMRESIKKVINGNGVTSIGNYAFCYCTALTSVTIPDSVTRLGDHAFTVCTALTSVTIPDSVTSIDVAAFYNCLSLTSVTIGNSVTSIGGFAFYNCAMTSVTIPDSVTSIGGSAFGDCASLTSITIPDSVTSIGGYAFRSCYSLTSVTIGNSVTSIGDRAFDDCTALTSVTIGNSVTSIGDLAFYNCRSLTSLTIGSSVTSIGDRAFYYCESLTSVTIPDSVTSIGTWAFSNCTSLTSVTIPDSVTSIGNYAFSNCESLTSVTIPDSVTSIGNSAFLYCTALTSVTIPDSVTSIGDSAFLYCTALTSVTIPDSVTSIGGYAFRDCTALTSVTIPNSVMDICENAFEGCTALTSVTIPSSVRSIGRRAFASCDSLMEITVAAGNQNYSSDSGVLFNKNKTELIQCPGGMKGSYAIPSSVSSIGYSAFYGCTSLTSVTISDSVTSIGEAPFSSCISLTKISVVSENANYSSDGSGVLFNKNKTELIQCPGGMKGSYAIPSSVSNISENAFEGCTSLTSVTIGNGVKSIGEFAFYRCTALKSLTFGNSLTDINYRAFAGCISLTSVTIPDSVKRIEERAFENCTSLTSVFIPDSVTIIGDDAFTNCSDDFVIYGVAGHTVMEYAEEWNIPYVAVAAPKITTQPKSTTVEIGQSVTFQVAATGGALSYQWQFKKSGATSWSNWAGQTEATLTVTGSSTNGGCKYRCVVSNPLGKKNSNYATLTVSAASVPVITTQPKAQTTTKGKTVTFKVVAGGSGLSCQWQYSKDNGASWTNWSGKTAASLSVTGSATNNGCLYRCVVKNAAGSVTSSSARLTVSDVAPVILTQPKAQTTTKGKTVTFKVVAGGSGLSYQWQYSKNNGASWTNWSGKTSASLSVTGSATNSGCLYRCVVKNSVASVTSSSARLTVSDVAPVILTQPANASASVGKTATFKVVAAGSGLSYQWQYKKAGATSWTNWSGKTSATLTVTASSTNGGCRYRCVVKNSHGTVTSNAATLTVK